MWKWGPAQSSGRDYSVEHGGVQGGQGLGKVFGQKSGVLEQGSGFWVVQG